MNVLFAMFNGWEIAALLAVVLIIFGAKRLPGLARGLGLGIKEFRNASEEEKPEADKTKTEFI